MQARSSHFSRPDLARPWYVQPWPWLLMLGPMLVIIAGAYTCWLAFTRPDALVVDDYYIQGKAINQDLRRDQAAAVLALSATLRYDPASGRLSGTIDSAGKPLATAVRVHLVHSTQPEKDIVLTLAPDAAGRLTGSLPMLEQTRWRVLIENPAREWRMAGIWAWPKQAGIALRADSVRVAPPSTVPVH
ncbi:MAG: FixH family protein [Herminiimonas sp.]|nr:FixH family protein [Herminiimonas sp.]